MVGFPQNAVAIDQKRGLVIGRVDVAAACAYAEGNLRFSGVVFSVGFDDAFVRRLTSCGRRKLDGSRIRVRRASYPEFWGCCVYVHMVFEVARQIVVDIQGGCAAVVLDL